MKGSWPNSPFSWASAIDRALVAYCLGWLFSYPATLLSLAMMAVAFDVAWTGALLGRFGLIAIIWVVLFVLNWYVAPVFVLLFALLTRMALNGLITHLMLGAVVGMWIAFSPWLGGSVGAGAIGFGGAVGAISGGAAWWTAYRTRRNRLAALSIAKLR